MNGIASLDPYRSLRFLVLVDSGSFLSIVSILILDSTFNLVSVKVFFFF